MGRKSREKWERRVAMARQGRQIPSARPVAQLVRQEQTMRAGPIPEATELAHYERIHPGLANRIMTMAENEAASRQSLATNGQHAKIDDDQRGRAERRIGQFSALFLATLALILSFWAALKGHETFGTILGASTIGTLCVAFLTGKIAEARAKQS